MKKLHQLYFTGIGIWYAKGLPSAFSDLSREQCSIKKKLAIELLTIFGFKVEMYFLLM